jgi:hypothetical protein
LSFKNLNILSDFDMRISDLWLPHKIAAYAKFPEVKTCLEEA